MKNTLQIGGIKFENPFILAPLAGYTDKTMRALCEEQGASLVFTEMVSGKGLKYGDRKSRLLLELTDEESAAMDALRAYGSQTAGKIRSMQAVKGAAGFQLFGDEPEVLYEAARELASCDNVILDLNCGCPVPKIVRNGEGSALLKRLDVLYECVAAMVAGSQMGAGESSDIDAAPKPVTAKIRMGFARGENVAAEAAKAIEAAGAAAVTVHGRTRDQFYEGTADWDVISEVKNAVSIPVIGNGDVRSGEDAIRMMEETGCDGVMIARGALGNPWIFQEACALWRGDGEFTASSDYEGFISPTDEERIRQLLHHLDLVCEDKGERVAVREMRKHVGWYIKGMRGATQIRRRINTAATVAEMKQILTGK